MELSYFLYYCIRLMGGSDYEGVLWPCFCVQLNKGSLRWDWYMMTSWNGNIFRVTGPLCGEFTGPGEFLTQRPVTRRFDVFFDLHLNKRLSKQPWGWWFETPSWSLWRHRNVDKRRQISPWHWLGWINEFFSYTGNYISYLYHFSLEKG